MPRNNYDNLFDSFTIRCHVFNHLRATYEPFKEEKFHPAVKSIDDKDLGFRDWADFTYSGKGGSFEDPTLEIQHFQGQELPLAQTPTKRKIVLTAAAQPIQTNVPTNMKQADVERWVKQVPKTEFGEIAMLGKDHGKALNALSQLNRKASVASKFYQFSNLDSNQVYVGAATDDGIKLPKRKGLHGTITLHMVPKFTMKAIKAARLLRAGSFREWQHSEYRLPLEQSSFNLQSQNLRYLLRPLRSLNLAGRT